jgi:hypothetical protein
MSDLALLMQKDPLQLTDVEFASLIEHYRKNRTAFNTLKAKTGSAAKVKKVAASQALIKDLDLGTLELDL